jgi:hypothetical protein
MVQYKLSISVKRRVHAEVKLYFAIVRERKLKGTDHRGGVHHLRANSIIKSSTSIISLPISRKIFEEKTIIEAIEERYRMPIE